MTRPWARLRWGGDARVNVTSPSFQVGRALPTGALAKVRTISPAAFICGDWPAGAVAGGVVAGGGGAAAVSRARAGPAAVATAAITPASASAMIRGLIIGSTPFDRTWGPKLDQLISSPRIVPVPDANEFSGIPM